MNSLTILICTHNRVSLLSRLLESINSAERSLHVKIKLLVIANACSDETVSFLENYQTLQNQKNWLPLVWHEEPIPGKSHALNRAIPLIETNLVAFVDDDHRIDKHFLVSIIKAAASHPEFSMFCGRILPDWDGTEPDWVHETGKYKIRPLPIPRSDSGPLERELTIEDPTPGGGNLFIRTDLFDRIGNFPTEFGPRGHDLGGSEDSIFIQRALKKGERLLYCPNVFQYHFVDTDRLKFIYVLKKAYYRSLSSTLAHQNSEGVPLYMWRKLLTYAFLAILSININRLRYFLVRVASTLGEIFALREGKAKRHRKA